MHRKRSFDRTVRLCLTLLFLTACGPTDPEPTSVPIPPPTAASVATSSPNTNRPPIANTSSIKVDQDTSAFLDLRTLASDPDSDPLTFAVLTRPNQGSTTIITSALTFTPLA